MARPKKIVAEQSDSIESTETPQEAPVSLSEVFLLKDPNLIREAEKRFNKAPTPATRT